MKSDFPKCLYPLFRKPMIEYILDTVTSLPIFHEIITVIGYKKELFEQYLSGKVQFAYQNNEYGTGSAAKAAIPFIKEEGYTLIIPADKPLLTKEILLSIIETHLKEKNDVTVVTTYDKENKHYGRILLDENDNIQEIIEYKDATFLQRINLEMNTSLYCINNKIYSKLINEIKLHDKELLLTDIIQIAYFKKLVIGKCYISKYQSFYGMNDFFDLSKMENYIRMKINENHMKNGICMVSPETITIGKEVLIEPGTIIYPNTYITGNTVIKEKAIIGPQTEIHNSIIGQKSIIKHSLIYDSVIGDNCTVGPFAHLRMNNIIQNNIRIGNFVEIKNSTIDEGTKASHLSYIGDARLGKNVNLGCGAITVNYDGKNKYQTKIGNNVFVGCNSNLIAPLNIDDNVVIAAGSTITTNIPKDAFSIARSYQITKEGYALKYPYAKKFIKNDEHDKKTK